MADPLSDERCNICGSLNCGGYCLEYMCLATEKELEWETKCMIENFQDKRDSTIARLTNLVTRARILLTELDLIPCTCIDAYRLRGLVAPDCPRCSGVGLDAKGWDDLVAWLRETET